MCTKRLLVAVLSVFMVFAGRFAVAASTVSEPPPVLPNDNLCGAGTVVDGTLILNLRAAEGLWRPVGDAGPRR